MLNFYKFFLNLGGFAMKKENIKPDIVRNEKEVLKFWEESNIFEKLKEKNKKSGK